MPNVPLVCRRCCVSGRFAAVPVTLSLTGTWTRYATLWPWWPLPGVDPEAQNARRRDRSSAVRQTILEEAGKRARHLPVRPVSPSGSRWIP